jgi:peptide-methionine (S)-S-oxide reductase
MEAVFEHLKGVSEVVSGFAGGTSATASYERVGSGETGHAEAVKITYDPSQISYGQLLKIYFSVAHDPTELNRQGPDTGTQYRSAIFFENDQQKKVAQAYIKQLNQEKVFSAPIVTTLVPLQGFYDAEDYHQNFIQHNPTYPYVVVHDLPKLAQLKQQFPSLYKQ